MKTVPLHGMHGTGRVALVDDEDYDLVAQYRWLARRGRNDTYYAIRYIEGGRRQVAMHSLITGFERTDHENHDGLDNRRENLRDGSGSRNVWNTRKIAEATSRFKGVSWDSARKKWIVHIVANGTQVHLGRWTSEERAARIYDDAARMLHGEYAVLNFPGVAPSDGDLPPEVDRSLAARTHCVNSHKYTPENTRLAPDGRGGTYRECRECRREIARVRRRQAGVKPRGSGNGYIADRRNRGAA